MKHLGLWARASPRIFLQALVAVRPGYGVVSPTPYFFTIFFAVAIIMGGHTLLRRAISTSRESLPHLHLACYIRPMAKQCSPTRTSGYRCPKRSSCDALAAAAKNAGFTAVVKPPLPSHPGWEAEISYPLGTRGIWRDREVGALAKRFRSATWSFSDAGPFSC